MTTLTVPQRLMRPVATRPARRSLGLGLLVGLVIGIALIVALSLGLAIVNAGTVMPGVRVAGVELAGLDRAGVEDRLRDQLPSLREGSATLEVGDVSETVTFAELGRDYEYQAMADAALAVTRNDNPFADGLARLRALVHPTSLPVVVHGYDPALLARVAESIAERAEVTPIDAAVRAEGASFAVSEGADGRSIDPAVITAALAGPLESADPADIRVQLSPRVIEPVVTTDEAREAANAARRMVRALQLTVPGATEDAELDAALRLAPSTLAAWIDFGPADGSDYAAIIDEAAAGDAIAALAEVIDQEPIDAQYSVAGGGLVGGVIPGQDGRTLDAAASTQALLATLQGRAEGRATASLGLSVAIEEPALTTAEAEAVFPQLQMVSSWTTNYVPGISNGWGANISIPAWDLDGYTIAPGAWFSFWEGIGPVTTARGYTQGGAIINGRSQPTGALAGGICSTSTTLFNAAMRMGLEIGIRAEHYYYIDRYPIGLDATVSIIDGYVQDMTFRNDTPYPVVIRGFGSPGSVTFQLWSVPTGRTVALSAPYTTNHVAARDTTVEDPSLAPGTSVRDESPHNGFQATVSRTVYDASGAVLHQNTWFSNYRAVNGVVRVGPGATGQEAADPGTGGGTAGTGSGDAAP